MIVVWIRSQGTGKPVADAINNNRNVPFPVVFYIKGNQQNSGSCQRFGQLFLHCDVLFGSFPGEEISGKRVVLHLGNIGRGF